MMVLEKCPYEKVLQVKGLDVGSVNGMAFMGFLNDGLWVPISTPRRVLHVFGKEGSQDTVMTHRVVVAPIKNLLAAGAV